jgi:predicted metal-dependent enzyme (double-stranded beta helix superfamily)
VTTPTLYVHPALLPVASAVTGRGDWPVGDLAWLTRLLAADVPAALRAEAVHDPVERWYLRLALTEHVEVWLLTWTPGQSTRPHDHGGAAGSYTVLDGVLTETWRDSDGPSRRSVRPQGTGSAFGPERVHIVRNRGLRNATSVHAYSPPLLPLGEGRVEEPVFAEPPA